MVQHTLVLKTKIKNNMHKLMLFHLSDFSDMWSVQEDDVTSADKPVNKKTKKISFKGPQRIATRLSPFVEQDLVLQIENTKLHVVKDQLMKESPVFNRMLTSDFKEKDEKEIKLDGKNLNDFVEFLRCTLPGIDEDVNGKITLTYLKMYSNIYL